MASTPLIPDLLYQRQREALLGYEDARFRTLTAGVPDYYDTLSDYTVFGCFLRSIAMELARLEYAYSYDLVSQNPALLTPPDMKRRWAAPLYVSKSFPTPSQSAEEYQQMLADLIPAYLEGATVDAIAQVITAYTGQTVPVLELYKQIGNGIYTDADANTLSVTLDASSSTASNPFEETVSASALAALSQNLYSAIDLAKPAHVGLDFSITFGSGEDLTRFTIGIEDVLEIIYFGDEKAPLPPVFTLSPFEDPSSPDTELSAYGKLVGEYFLPMIDATQYAGLLSADFRAEYALNPDGTYSLLSTATGDIILVDGSGNPTGAISRAQGVLAPQWNLSWEIKSDEMVILRMS